MDATVVLGKQGRLVIPADVRTALRLSAGDRLQLHVSGSGIVLRRGEDAVAGLKALGAGVPRERSLVEELLSERRREADAG